MNYPSPEVLTLQPAFQGSTTFYCPQSSDETILVHVAAGTVEALFVHRYQTDQLIAVAGKAVLVILFQGQYQYIVMDTEQPRVIRIPPRVPHGVVNPTNRTCVVVNALLRHGPVHPLDVRPVKPPFPYDLAQIATLVS